MLLVYNMYLRGHIITSIRNVTFDCRREFLDCIPTLYSAGIFKLFFSILSKEKLYWRESYELYLLVVHPRTTYSYMNT